MTDPTPAATATAEKKGRGPTRPAIRCADAIEAALALDTEARKVLDDAVAQGRKAATIRADIKAGRVKLRETTNAAEAAWRRDERAAAILEDVDVLPLALRALFVAALRETITPTMPGGDAT